MKKYKHSKETIEKIRKASLGRKYPICNFHHPRGRKKEEENVLLFKKLINND